MVLVGTRGGWGSSEGVVVGIYFIVSFDFGLEVGMGKTGGESLLRHFSFFLDENGVLYFFINKLSIKSEIQNFYIFINSIFSSQ